jgi:predicted RecB family nuclease
MPAYKYHGMLVYFAGYEKHIGFYPTGSGIKHFEKMLSDYKFSKGTIQFKFDQELPFDLIEQIIAFRVAENLNKAQKKKLHTCVNGHNFKKSSECRTCPICEEETKLANPFLEKFSAPARRALEKEGITTLEKLAFYKPEQLLLLHGFGPSSLKVVVELLNTNKTS